MPEKAKIVVAPNVEMNIDITADNITDIHVAAMEEELERLEKALTVELKEDEEASEDIKKKFEKATKEFGLDFTDEMEKDLIPVMKRYGFKGLHATFAASFPDEDKVAISLGLAIEGKRTMGDCYVSGAIQASRNVPFIPHLKALHTSVKTAEEKVKKTTEKLMKVKETLGNIPKLERKARAQMSAQLLQTTDTGRQLLDMLKSKKVIGMDKE
jgi:hypothetical protein